MRSTYSILAFPFFILLAMSGCCLAQAENPNLSNEVGITQHLGQMVPRDIQLVDENGNFLTLGNVLNKPTILALVYFDCPNICGPLLTNLATTVDEMQMQPGKDYDILSVSFDPEENSALASQKKANFIRAAKKEIPDNAWRFLTGDEANIRALTKAVGFNYKKEGNEFAHPTTLILLSAQGKITRYIPGISHPAADVEMAINQAAKGEVGATRALGDSSWGPEKDRRRYLSFCFSYNPQSGRYVFEYTRIVGSLVLLAAAGFVGFLTMRSTRKSRGVSHDKSPD